jgi:hypothetical protein
MKDFPREKKNSWADFEPVRRRRASDTAFSRVLAIVLLTLLGALAGGVLVPAVFLHCSHLFYRASAESAKIAVLVGAVVCGICTLIFALRRLRS